MLQLNRPLELIQAMRSELDRQGESIANKHLDLDRMEQQLASLPPQPAKGWRQTVHQYFQTKRDKDIDMILDKVTKLEAAIGKLLALPPTTVPDPNDAIAETRIDALTATVEAKLPPPPTTTA